MHKIGDGILTITSIYAIIDSEVSPDMKTEKEQFPVLKFVSYLAVACFAIMVAVTSGDAIDSLKRLQCNDIPAINGQTRASIKNLVAKSLDDRIAEEIALQLYAMKLSASPSARLAACGRLQDATMYTVYYVSNGFAPSIPVRIPRPTAR